MAQALYRKYRSRSFKDVVGQDHITKTLENALKNGKISHAYLLTGPRGVGKTSVARILAHVVNNLIYSDESVHLDIIEIDAASNRRIDEIRDLRERVRIAPTSAKYKVYIIDEVHMLTREAFNALLKTLEEPPAHCIFILATTEAHKLPDTIVSRTQRFEFKPVSKHQAAQHLGNIAKREKIQINKDALELLAEFGNGSFRDSISYLDQLSSLEKPITEVEVRELLGLPTTQEIDQLFEVLDSDNTAAVLATLIKIESKGTSPQAVAAALSARLRQSALSGSIARRQLKLLRSLTEVSSKSRPQDALEISLLDFSLTALDNPTAIPKKHTQPNHTGSPARKSVAEAEIETDSIISKPASFDIGAWDEVVSRCRDEAASIYTALRLARPEFHEGRLILSFRFPLHKKKLEQSKNKDILVRLVEKVYGSFVEVEYTVDKDLLHNSSSPTEVSGAQASVISSIFGSAEVIEA